MYEGMRSPLARLSLLGRFGLMSLAVVVVLGLAIGITLKRQIEDRALGRATQLAEVIADVGVQPRLTASDLARPLSAKRLDALDSVLDDHFTRENQLVRVKVFDRAATIVYSDDRSIIGESEAGDHGV